MAGMGARKGVYQEYNFEEHSSKDTKAQIQVSWFAFLFEYPLTLLLLFIYLFDIAPTFHKN